MAASLKKERKFFKLAFKLKLTSVESVKTACVGIDFFYHHFKIMVRTAMLYLIDSLFKT